MKDQQLAAVATVMQQVIKEPAAVKYLNHPFGTQSADDSSMDLGTVVRKLLSNMYTNEVSVLQDTLSVFQKAKETYTKAEVVMDINGLAYWFLTLWANAGLPGPDPVTNQAPATAVTSAAIPNYPAQTTMYGEPSPSATSAAPDSARPAQAQPAKRKLSPAPHTPPPPPTWSPVNPGAGSLQTQMAEMHSKMQRVQGSFQDPFGVAEGRASAPADTSAAALLQQTLGNEFSRSFSKEMQQTLSGNLVAWAAAAGAAAAQQQHQQQQQMQMQTQASLLESYLQLNPSLRGAGLGAMNSNPFLQQLAGTPGASGLSAFIPTLSELMRLGSNSQLGFPGASTKTDNATGSGAVGGGGASFSAAPRSVAHQASPLGPSQGVPTPARPLNTAETESSVESAVSTLEQIMQANNRLRACLQRKRSEQGGGAGSSAHRPQPAAV